MLSLVLCATLIQSRPELPPLGTNLAGISDGTTQWPLNDLFKLSSPWVGYNADDDSKKPTELSIDKNGNVASLKPGQVAAVRIFTNGKNPIGSYFLSWKGKGTLIGGGSSETVSESEGKAEILIKDNNGIDILIKKVDPSDPPHDIKLEPNGVPFGDSPFHPIFLQRMSLYRALRFCDWGAIDNSPQKDWEDRATIGQQRYTGAKGMPFELMIQLVNEKVSVPWFCVPHLAGDKYVQSLAELIKEKLRPDAQVMIEYSNECWNPEWQQSEYCSKEGMKAKLSEKASEAGDRFYARRSTEVFDIFAKVFGGTSRLIRVLSAPFDNLERTESLLTWQNTYRKVDALAVAPYFGATLGADGTKPGSLDEIFEKLTGQIKGTWRDQIFAVGGLASKYRLNLVAYAGGQKLVTAGSDRDEVGLNNLFDQANTDQRMYDTYTSALKTWRAAGGKLFMHYLDCAPMTKAGRFGAVEFQNQDTLQAQKHRALLRYALFPNE